jgi:hypothetical protein
MKDQFELFNLVIDTSRSYRQAYLHNFWTTSGFLIVAIGWLLSIDKSKIDNSILADVGFRGACSVCLVLFFIHVGVLVYTCWKSKKLFKMFKSISIDSNWKREEKNLLFYGIPVHWVIVDVVVNGIFLGALLFLLSILK